jgi:predicted amidophosphoribosyltransferase
MPWRPWEDVLALVELAAPSGCGGCGAAGVRWCDGCGRLLEDAIRAVGRWSPTPSPPGLPPTWSAAPYADQVRQSVVAWKDGGRADLTPVLAPVLRSVLGAAIAGSAPHHRALLEGRQVLLLPAPSARSGTRARGEHRVAALLRTATRGLPTSGLRRVDALRLGRRVADQAGLGARERRANLAGAVGVRPALHDLVRGVPCVVVDDVVTTGATLAECARALREAGSGPVVAATLAATRRRVGTDLPQPRGSD